VVLGVSVAGGVVVGVGGVRRSPPHLPPPPPPRGGRRGGGGRPPPPPPPARCEGDSVPVTQGGGLARLRLTSLTLGFDVKRLRRCEM
jgi:hypothetical protein